MATWVHVRDAVDAICHLLEASGRASTARSTISARRLHDPAEAARTRWWRGIVPRQVEIESTVIPIRARTAPASPRFEALGFKATRSVEDGVREICEALRRGAVDCSERTIQSDVVSATRGRSAKDRLAAGPREHLRSRMIRACDDDGPAMTSATPADLGTSRPKYHEWRSAHLLFRMTRLADNAREPQTMGRTAPPVRAKKRAEI